MKTSSWYVVKQRLAWIKMHERGTPVTGVCDHYGISRKTFYKWYGRYQESDRDFHVLNDRSRRPHTHPRSVPNRVGERVVAMRRKTRYGHQAHSLLPGPGRHHHQRLWCLPCLAESRPGTQATLKASQEASELRHGCPRPAGPDRRQVPASLAPEGSSRIPEAVPLQRHRRLYAPSDSTRQF